MPFASTHSAPADLLEADDVRLLIDVGFIALSAGRLNDADVIFSGAKAARPGQEAGPLGLAMVELARGRVASAIAILKSLPPSDAAQTYLGLALMRQGARDEARAILDNVAATAGEQAFVDLAREALDADGR